MIPQTHQPVVCTHPDTGRPALYTRDLYLCWEQFARFYPEHSSQMYQVLANCMTGENSPLRYADLVAFVADEQARLRVP